MGDNAAMAHIPVNHQLRPLYRTLAGLVGTYILLFGIVGTAMTWGEPLFDRANTWSLGLRTNLAFALLSIVAGVVILLAAFVGGNLDHFVNLVGGVVFLVSGIVMMLLLQTDGNFLNFSMTTCIVSFIIGLLLLTAGLYSKVGADGDAKTEEAFRRNLRPEARPGGLAGAGRPAPAAENSPPEGSSR